MGDGKIVILGEDAWMGDVNNYMLSLPLLNLLRENNIFSLKDVSIRSPQLTRRLGWRDMNSLGLHEVLTEEWAAYIKLRCENFISLDEDVEDSLCWSQNHRNGSYSIKLSCKSWMGDRLEGRVKCWWKPLWKMKSPPRCEITFCLTLNNKLLTWDNGHKRGWHGPNRCPLCNSNSESISHIFISCLYAGQVSALIKEKHKIKDNWNTDSLEESFRS